MTVISRQFNADDVAVSRYQYLPIDVDHRGVRINLEYPRGADAVVDLGLIDPLGFSGWSGGARSEILIGEYGATAGYLDRGVPAGDGWAVMLGLHRLSAHGATITVTIEGLDGEIPAEPLAPPTTARPTRRDLPAPPGTRWFAGDLHSHSRHSDGALSLDVLAAAAAGAGLDFLAVTDHNTVSHHPLLAASSERHAITLLPGQEVTTADGHANAFGAIGWIDFRRPAAEWFSEVNERGGLISINHPLGYDCSWRHPLPPGGLVFVEAWNGTRFDPADTGPLAWWQAATEVAATPVALGGSDFHRPSPEATVGEPVTWIAAKSPTVDDLFAGLCAGRVAVSRRRSGPVLLDVGGEMLTAVDADGAVLVCPSTARTIVRSDRADFHGHHGLHVLETPNRERLALTTTWS